MPNHLQRLLVQTQALEAMVVDTHGGRIHVQWDRAASASANAQLTFFAEFLATLRFYESWVDSCPLELQQSQRTEQTRCAGHLALVGPGRAGHKRYAHITGLRSDALSPQVLGVNKIISEDALRRASARMSAEQSCGWLMPQLLGSVQAALNTPGYWTSTPPSKPCTANKKGPRSATTPTSPDAEATPCGLRGGKNRPTIAALAPPRPTRIGR